MCHYRSKVPNVLIAITVFHVNLCYMSTSRRDAAQWLERYSLPMSLPAVRFRTRLGAEYSEKCHVSPLSMFGHMFRCCVLGQDTLPSHALLISCVKKYLGGQIWQCVRGAEIAAGLYALRGVKMAHERLGLVTNG